MVVAEGAPWTGHDLRREWHSGQVVALANPSAHTLLLCLPGPPPHKQEAAQQGDTAAPSAEEEVDLHFAAFLCRDGALYELDGR